MAIVSALKALYPKRINDLDLDDRIEKLENAEELDDFKNLLVDNYKRTINKNRKINRKLEIWNVVVIWCIIFMIVFFCLFMFTFLSKAVLHLQ